MKFLVETSARHAHVSQADLETLFGPGYQLTIKKDLSQPGQYASNEKVTVNGPRGQLIVTILGPVRKSTQVELSMTDARQIGLTPPIRESGDTAGSAGCRIWLPGGARTPCGRSISASLAASSRWLPVSLPVSTSRASAPK